MQLSPRNSLFKTNHPIHKTVAIPNGSTNTKGLRYPQEIQQRQIKLQLNFYKYRDLININIWVVTRDLQMK